jgi:hypothetical protein
MQMQKILKFRQKNSHRSILCRQKKTLLVDAHGMKLAIYSNELDDELDDDIDFRVPTKNTVAKDEK